MSASLKILFGLLIVGIAVIVFSARQEKTMENVVMDTNLTNQKPLIDVQAPVQFKTATFALG